MRELNVASQGKNKCESITRKRRKKDLNRGGSPNPLREEELVAAVLSYRLVG